VFIVCLAVQIQGCLFSVNCWVRQGSQHEHGACCRSSSSVQRSLISRRKCCRSTGKAKLSVQAANQAPRTASGKWGTRTENTERDRYPWRISRRVDRERKGRRQGHLLEAVPFFRPFLRLLASPEAPPTHLVRASSQRSLICRRFNDGISAYFHYLPTDPTP
jgi:hypothetical protein